MNTALLIARLLLALVFAVAGVAKLMDRAGSRRSVMDFGLPASLAAPLGIFVPLAELVVAAALIPPVTAWWGALGALGLLLLFAAGIATNLARGHKPDCHCFGQLHSSPAGWRTLARNGVLAAVAGFVLWQGRGDAGPSVFGWLADLSRGQLVGLVGGLVVLGLLAAQWWFLIHLLRQNGRLLVRLDAIEEGLVAAGLAPAPPQAQPAAGLPPGAPAPTFSLAGLSDEEVTLDSLRASNKPVVLVFTDPDCGPCTALLPDIGRWQRDYDDKVTILLVGRGTPEENRAKTSEHGVEHVLLQEDREVAEAYEASATPSAVLVRPDGTIGSPLAIGSEAIAALVARAVGTARVPCPNCGNGHAAAPTIPVGQKIGDPAPEIQLKDLGGKNVSLSDFGGSETLVLFWNPGCGFCQQMLEDLKEWERHPPKGAPRLLVFSAGAVEANEAMGLRSPVVLDQEFAVGRAFGASGTPSAVLLDAEGRVASEVAVGAPAVLALAGIG